MTTTHDALATDPQALIPWLRKQAEEDRACGWPNKGAKHDAAADALACYLTALAGQQGQEEVVLWAKKRITSEVLEPQIKRAWEKAGQSRAAEYCVPLYAAPPKAEATQPTQGLVEAAQAVLAAKRPHATSDELWEVDLPQMAKLAEALSASTPPPPAPVGMVPMTAEEIHQVALHSRVPMDYNSQHDFTQGIRAAEAHHFGEKK